MDEPVLDQPGGYASVTHDGITIQSNDETADQIRTALAIEPPADEAPAGDPAVPTERHADGTFKKAAPRNDPRARVEQATAKEAAAKRERDEAKAESAALKARLEALEKPPAPRLVAPVAPVTGDPEPQEADYPDYRQYVKAQASWEAERAIERRDTARQHEAVQQQRETYTREVDRAFCERYSAILTADPDFPTRVDPRLLTTPRTGVLADPSTATFGNFLVEQVFQSEQPKALLEYLSDPSVVQRLATLPPAQVIRALAKVEYGAASPAAPASIAPAISHAKPPIQPVGTSHVASTDTTPPDDESSDEQYFAWKSRQRAAKRKRA